MIKKLFFNRWFAAYMILIMAIMVIYPGDTFGWRYWATLAMCMTLNIIGVAEGRSDE